MLLHHIYQFGEISIHPIVNFILQNLGFISVSVFFFLSGFGLSASIQKHGYINRFPRNRIVVLITEYLILVFIYAIQKKILAYDVDFITVLSHTITIGKTEVIGGWYLQVTLLAYFVFFIVCSQIINRSTRIAIYAGAIVIFCLICRYFNLLPTYYECTPCLLLGSLIYYNQQYVWNKMRLVGKMRVIGIFSFLLFAFCFFLWLRHRTGITFFKIISSSIIPFLVVVFLYIERGKLIDNSKVLLWLGSHSFEIYVLQGLFLYGFRNIRNTAFYSVAVVTSTILLTSIITPVRVYIEGCWKRYRT